MITQAASIQVVDENRFGWQIRISNRGSSGIGLATARLLSTQGAHTWLVARNTERLHSALSLVEGCRRESTSAAVLPLRM